MKRLFAIALILVLSITGCGKAPEPKVTGQPAPPVITLWHSYQGEALKGLEKASNDLNATNPNFRLELVYITADKYLTKFNQARLAGKGPDLLIVPANTITELYADMAIQPLDKFLDPGPYFKAGIEALSFNGSLMAVPKSVSVPLLVYNRDLVQAPGSLEQLIDDATKVTQNKTVGLAGDLSNPYLTGQLYSAHGARLFAADARPDLNTPEGLAYLQSVTALGGLKAGTSDSGTAAGLISAGTTPYGIMETTELAAYKGMGKNLGFAPIPGPAGRVGKSYIKADGFVISTNCAFPKEAVAAAVYLTSPSVLKLFSINQGEFPANPGGYDDAPFKDNPEAQLVKGIATGGTGYPLDSRSNTVFALISEMTRTVLTGTPADQSAAAAQEKALKALGFDNP